MAKNLYRSIGKRIAVLRATANITQEAVAEAASIGTSYIARIEGGSRKPTLDVLDRIASALKVQTWQLLAEDRMTPGEETWRGEAMQLGEAVRGLPVEDVTLLVQLAKRLGAKRRGR